MDVLFFLLLGHFCGDYALQTDKTAERKKSSTGVLTRHVLIYTICIWAFLAMYSILYLPGLYLKTATILFLVFLLIEHWGQDHIKNRLAICTRQMHYIDQVVHIALLYVYRIFIFPYY